MCFLQVGSLELDLEHYVVPAPASACSGAVYAANLAETPRYLRSGIFSKGDASSSSHGSSKGNVLSAEHVASRKVFTNNPYSN